MLVFLSALSTEDGLVSPSRMYLLFPFASLLTNLNQPCSLVFSGLFEFLVFYRLLFIAGVVLGRIYVLFFLLDAKDALFDKGKICVVLIIK